MPERIENLVTGGAAQIYSAFYHFLLPLATAFAGTYCIAVALPPLLAKLMILVMQLYTKACFEVDRTGVEPALTAYPACCRCYNCPFIFTTPSPRTS